MPIAYTPMFMPCFYIFIRAWGPACLNKVGHRRSQCSGGIHRVWAVSHAVHKATPNMRHHIIMACVPGIRNHVLTFTHLLHKTRAICVVQTCTPFTRAVLRAFCFRYRSPRFACTYPETPVAASSSCVGLALVGGAADSMQPARRICCPWACRALG